MACIECLYERLYYMYRVYDTNGSTGAHDNNGSTGAHDTNGSTGAHDIHRITGAHDTNGRHRLVSAICKNQFAHSKLKTKRVGRYSISIIFHKSNFC